MNTKPEHKSESQGAARERIATACLAAMIGRRSEWKPGMDGQALAELACEYADSLLVQLSARSDSTD